MEDQNAMARVMGANPSIDMRLISQRVQTFDYFCFCWWCCETSHRLKSIEDQFPVLLMGHKILLEILQQQYFLYGGDIFALLLHLESFKLLKRADLSPCLVAEPRSWVWWLRIFFCLKFDSDLILASRQIVICHVKQYRPQNKCEGTLVIRISTSLVSNCCL